MRRNVDELAFQPRRDHDGQDLPQLADAAGTKDRPAAQPPITSTRVTAIDGTRGNRSARRSAARQSR